MQKNKILVIDDEADFARLLKSNLEETGKYEVLILNHMSIVLGPRSYCLISLCRGQRGLRFAKY